MTKESIEQQLSVYKNKYNIENAVQDIQSAVEDAGLELGNIICLFTYRRDRLFRDKSIYVSRR